MACHVVMGQLSLTCWPNLQETSIFDMPLAAACAKYDTLIPVHLQRLVAEIESRALDEEGLFRLPGARSAVRWPGLMFMPHSYSPVFTAGPTQASLDRRSSIS
jgi:hypothetical protein